jgi:hypothetical protein
MLLLIVEIAMLVLGSIGLTSGKLAFSRSLVVEGKQARIMGSILAVPVPLMFLTGILLRISRGTEASSDVALLALASRMEIGLVACCLIGAFGYAYATRPVVPPAIPGRAPSESPAINPDK